MIVILAFEQLGWEDQPGHITDPGSNKTKSKSKPNQNKQQKRHWGGFLPLFPTTHKLMVVKALAKGPVDDMQDQNSDSLHALQTKCQLT